MNTQIIQCEECPSVGLNVLRGQTEFQTFSLPQKQDHSNGKLLLFFMVTDKKMSHIKIQ